LFYHLTIEITYPLYKEANANWGLPERVHPPSSSWLFQMKIWDEIMMKNNETGEKEHITEDERLLLKQIRHQ